jgi:hypothetical protein
MANAFSPAGGPSVNLQEMAVDVHEVDAATAVVPADFAEALPIRMKYYVKKTLPIPFPAVSFSGGELILRPATIYFVP